MGNVTFTYAELTSVKVIQPFYANKLSKIYLVQPEPDFELIPTGECLSTMRRLDLVFRQVDVNAGFIILARVLGKNGTGDDILRFSPRQDDKLTFRMVLRNPDVINFDDLPTGSHPGHLYYFTNRQTDGLAPRDNLHLCAAATGVDAANDRLKMASSIYRHHHATVVAAGTALVKHVLNGLEVAPESIVTQSGQSDLTFNLSTLPLGKCQLIISGGVVEEFFFAGDTVSRVFGVVELSLANTLASNYRTVEADRSLAKPRPVYSILFQNRKTRWRYTIHLQANSALALEMAALSASDKADFLNRLNVVTNDTTITFSRTSASDTDIVFVSDADLFLQEKYVSTTSAIHDPLSLALKKYTGVVAKEAVVRADLPYPATALIDATALPSIYSDIFITL